MSLQSMNYLQNTLTRQEWLDRTYKKSRSTRALRLAKAALSSLDSFCFEKYGKDSAIILAKLRDNPGDQIYIFLNNYVSSMDSKSPKTRHTYFGLIKSFLRTQGIKTDRDDVKEFVKLPTIIKVRRKPLTKEIIKKLLDNSKEQRKALYLTLLSSGMRLGEALSLRKRDFDFTKNPALITIPASYTKTRESRETFVSSEALALVIELVKNKADSDLVFARINDNDKAVQNEESIFQKLRRRCNFVEKYEESGRFIVNIHAFRAYFHTVASRINGTEYANALDGHTSYLGQYYRLSLEERSEMYKKLEPYLLIYGDTVEHTNTLKDQLQIRNEEVSKLTELIIEMKVNLDKREKEFENIRSELEKLKLWRQISEKYELIKS